MSEMGVFSNHYHIDTKAILTHNLIILLYKLTLLISSAGMA